MVVVERKTIEMWWWWWWWRRKENNRNVVVVVVVVFGEENNRILWPENLYNAQHSTSFSVYILLLRS